MNELDLEKLFETIKGKGDNVLNDAQKAIKKIQDGGVQRKRVSLPITVSTITEEEVDKVDRIIHGEEEPKMKIETEESVAHVYVDQIVSIDKLSENQCSLATTIKEYLIEKPIDDILKLIDEC